MSYQLLQKLARERLEKIQTVPLWSEYRSSQTGQLYIPQNDDIYNFINDDRPRYLLLKGGEGGGKSAAGVIKTLNRLKRGCNGIMVSTDMEHFKKSIWPTFREWCIWDRVIERHRYRRSEGWEPRQAFTLVFHNELGGYSELTCGGAKEDKIGTWEGPNVNFVHFDEARGHKTAGALKVFDGRIRIVGPNNESPQMYLTTTPRKHWLFEYFAGASGDEDSQKLVSKGVLDKYTDFKQDARVYTVLTEENPAIDQAFVKQRRQTLTESEARILLQALWENESDIDKFVNIIWWNNCNQGSEAIPGNQAMVIALDAATGSENPSYTADCFAMVMVSRDIDNDKHVAVRYCGIWEAQPGQYLDFEPIEQELRRLIGQYAILEVTYDPHQLHDMAMRIKNEGIALVKAFGQQKERLQADKQLQDLIINRRISHDGNPLLSQHIDNADIKKYGEDGIRIIKRSNSQKVDAAVALSMACSRILYYNL